MEPTLELKVESRDEDELAVIEEALRSQKGVELERVRPSRVVDPVTLIAVAGGVVGLVNGVLALADRLKGRGRAPVVVVRNAAGDELPVEGITREQLEYMISTSEV